MTIKWYRCGTVVVLLLWLQVIQVVRLIQSVRPGFCCWFLDFGLPDI